MDTKMTGTDSFEDKYRKWHTRLSYVKSSVRLLFCGWAAVLHNEVASAILILAVGLIIAEVIGVLEEII